MARPLSRVSIGRRGLMLVLSSPSGAGKSTIARNLLESDHAFELSVSVTTRPRRGSSARRFRRRTTTVSPSPQGNTWRCAW